MASTNVAEEVYVLNKRAKQYANGARAANAAGDTQKARKKRARKNALYDYKLSILETLVKREAIEKVTLHDIEGRDYYCLHIDGFSFHCPVSEFSINPSVQNKERLVGFNSSSSITSSRITERDALKRLEDEFGSVNKHLDQQKYCWTYVKTPQSHTPIPSTVW